MEYCPKCRRALLDVRGKCPICGYEKSKDNSRISSILWFVGILFVIYFLGKGCINSGGPLHPYDDSRDIDNSIEQEYQEGKEELKKYENDPCLEDASSGVPDEYSRCNTDSKNPIDELEIEPDYEQHDRSIIEQGSGCIGGCTIHKSDCDIKGNISAESGKKIFHVPGGEFYSSTAINPNYGDRWFCTEEEAISAGWRKSYK